MFSLPSLTKTPRAVLAGGRSGIPAGAEVCDACPSAKGKYPMDNILEKKTFQSVKRLARLTLILQLRGNGRQSLLRNTHL